MNPESAADHIESLAKSLGHEPGHLISIHVVALPMSPASLYEVTVKETVYDEDRPTVRTMATTHSVS